MLGIKIRDKFISLFDDTSVIIELRNPIGIIVDGTDTLQGSITFPIDIPGMM